VRLRPGGGRCGGRLRACDQVAHATRERWTSRWLAPVDGVVHPPAALLHAHAAPLRLSQQPPLGRILGNVFGQDDMTACGGTERERACELASSLSSEHASNTRARAGAEEAGAAPVLKLVVEILLRVLDLLGRHYAAGEGGGLHARGGLHTREPGARACRARSVPWSRVCVAHWSRRESRVCLRDSVIFLTRVSLDGSVSARQCYGNGLRELIFFTESSTVVE
jgi:hypothetical protein